MPDLSSLRSFLMRYSQPVDIFLSKPITSITVLACCKFRECFSLENLNVSRNHPKFYVALPCDFHRVSSSLYRRFWDHHVSALRPASHWSTKGMYRRRASPMAKPSVHADVMNLWRFFVESIKVHYQLTSPVRIQSCSSMSSFQDSIEMYRFTPKVHLAVLLALIGISWDSCNGIIVLYYYLYEFTSNQGGSKVFVTKSTSVLSIHLVSDLKILLHLKSLSVHCISHCEAERWKIDAQGETRILESGNIPIILFPKNPRVFTLWRPFSEAPFTTEKKTKKTLLPPSVFFITRHHRLEWVVRFWWCRNQKKVRYTSLHCCGDLPKPPVRGKESVDSVDEECKIEGGMCHVCMWCKKVRKLRKHSSSSKKHKG